MSELLVDRFESAFAHGDVVAKWHSLGMNLAMLVVADELWLEINVYESNLISRGIVPLQGLRFVFVMFREDWTKFDIWPAGFRPYLLRFGFQVQVHITDAFSVDNLGRGLFISLCRGH